MDTFRPSDTIVFSLFSDNEGKSKGSIVEFN